VHKRMHYPVHRLRACKHISFLRSAWEQCNYNDETKHLDPSNHKNHRIVWTRIRLFTI
jgi:hypothetical protein